mgnify:CR=1 FL=1
MEVDKNRKLFKNGDELDLIQLIINHGANIFHKHYLNLTPLHYAASSGNLNAIKYLTAKATDLG